jgi:hypothetical protein
MQNETRQTSVLSAMILSLEQLLFLKHTQNLQDTWNISKKTTVNLNVDGYCNFYFHQK